MSFALRPRAKRDKPGVSLGSARTTPVIRYRRRSAGGAVALLRSIVTVGVTVITPLRLPVTG
jgi:hypothetical protein